MHASRLYGRLRYVIAAALVSCMLISSPTAHADVTLDGTLGPGGPLAGPDYAISDNLGQLRGSNLFHSFGKFNINTGESATFTGPTSVENILGRVTGGSASLIDGRLSSQIPGANLYLMNPSGLMFGPNATLDISGSFHATTADYIGLADGGRFQANEPSKAVLTSAPPSAFGFLSDKPAPITIEKSRLEVPQGETLSVISGDIQITGEFVEFEEWLDPTSVLLAPSGRINLVSVASAGEALDQTPETLDDFHLQSFDSLGSIQLARANVTTTADPGGTVYIRGGQLTLNGGHLSASTAGDIDHSGIAIDVAVSGDMTLVNPNKNEELVQTNVSALVWGSGDGGDIHIRAENLRLTADNSGGIDFSGIITVSTGSGDAGDIDIQVQDRLEMRDAAVMLSRAVVSGSGDITITASDVELSNAGPDGNVNVSASGGFGTPETGDSGDAGNLTIKADTIRLRNGGGGFVGLNTGISVSAKGEPDAGHLRLEVGRLEILDGAQIGASILGGAGDGGTVDIMANSILIAGTDLDGAPAGIFATVQRPFAETGVGPPGSAGNIHIVTGDLEVREGGEISAFSKGLGEAGEIAIEARNVVRLSGPTPEGEFNRTGIFASASPEASAAGVIRLSTKTLLVLEGAEISGSTSGPATGGTVEITADSVLIAGEDIPKGVPSRIDTRTLISDDLADEATGRGGDVIIRAGNLELSDGGEISAASSSVGDSGNIALNVNQLSMDNGASITVESTNTGNAGVLEITTHDSFRSDRSSVSTEALQADGGNIQLTAGELVYLNESEITATVGGGVGRGGNVTIDPTFVVLNKSDIQANAFEGPGGNILIVTDNFIASADSAVTASSDFGVDGEVVIRSPEDTLIVGVEPLPESFLDVSSLLRERCAARAQAEAGSFVVLGRGGVPPGPDAALPSSDLDIDTKADAKSTSTTDSHEAERSVVVVQKGQRLVSGVQAVNGIMPARLVFSCGN